MKKLFFYFAACSLLFTSCQTVSKTARTADTSSSVRSFTVADLDVASERITHTLVPSSDLCRGGEENVRQAAEQEALRQNGNADVLLEPQYVITKKRGLFRDRITSITVTGRPAHFRNFRSLHDSVWTNPVFNGVCPRVSKPVGLFAKEKEFSFAKNTSETYSYRSKGYEWSMGLSAMYSSYDHNCDLNDKNYSDAAYSLLASYGYRFSPYFYLGAGTGFLYDMSGENCYMPLFVDARIDFSKKKNTFYIDYKWGYTPVDLADEGEPGAFGAMSLGYSFGSWDIAFQYMIQENKGKCGGYYYWEGYCDGVDEEKEMYGITLNFNF